jgi:hypothetical protein
LCACSLDPEWDEKRVHYGSSSAEGKLRRIWHNHHGPRAFVGNRVIVGSADSFWEQMREQAVGLITQRMSGG